MALPKVASTRLRAALEGLLEDRLLDDVSELHFALEPGGKSGQAVWVAVCQKTWLRSWLQILEGAGNVFGAAKADAVPPVDIKELHAKIGSLILENDFLEGALTKAGLLSVKR